MSFNKEEYLAALNWRYAVKKFDPTKTVSPEDWKVLEESLRLSPSSYGLQPWKFLVIQNKELRQKLTPASYNQTQVADCSHYVVFTTLRAMTEEYINKFIKKTAQVRGTPVESLEAYKQVMIQSLIKNPVKSSIPDWAHRQSYIAMGNIMTTAALMKIDTCPMEGLDAGKYDEILGLNQTEYATIAAVAVGYRHPEDKYQHAKKVRFEAVDVIEII